MKLALLDIDGVLANDTHRVHFALEREWAKYFDPERVAQDAVWQQGLDIARQLKDEGFVVGFLTGRREDLREVTEDWLLDNNFPFGRVTMRRADQKMPLANFKVEYMKKILASGHFDSVVLYEDDPEVIRLVHEVLGEQSGIHCTWHIKQKALVKAATA